MLNVIFLSVVLLNAVILSVIFLSVVRLNVVIPSAVALSIVQNLTDLLTTTVLTRLIHLSLHFLKLN
jgi:hypothetical protein